MSLLVKVWKQELRNLKGDEKTLAVLTIIYHSKRVNLAYTNKDLRKLSVKLEQDGFVKITRTRNAGLRFHM